MGGPRLLSSRGPPRGHPWLEARALLRSAFTSGLSFRPHEGQPACWPKPAERSNDWAQAGVLLGFVDTVSERTPQPNGTQAASKETNVHP